jgi:GTP1/Obg family GTP-binding protein
VATVKEIAVALSELATLPELEPVAPIVTVAGASNVGCAHPGAAISNAIASRIAEVLRSF